MVKTLVEDCLILDVNILHKTGVFSAPFHGVIAWSSGARIGYQINCELPNLHKSLQITYKTGAKSIHFGIPITYSRMPKGGYRPWFYCPIVTKNSRCNQRVTKLFLPDDDTIFGCRNCHKLVYRSQQEWTPKTVTDLFRSM